MSNAGKVEVERVVPAPREDVFRAWTDPDILKRWFGPGEFTVPDATLDVRPGGDYEIQMQPPGGGDAMTLVGTFRAIDPPSRLEFTWSWSRVWAQAPESLVVVEFDEVEDGTRVRITHGDFDDDQTAAPYRMGWESGGDKLVRHFEEERT
jgi:uncharacterized protein YndB with AHSA1/START domain